MSCIMYDEMKSTSVARRYMKNSNYEVRILINGKPVQEFDHSGNSYIESRIGTEYTIQIKNHNWQRILAVPSVDGVNVIDGKPATASSPGYIVNGNDSLEIKGFRKDNSSVGAFKFCQKSKSYCKEVGLTGNNGVIGVMIIQEAVKMWIGTSNEQWNKFYKDPDRYPWYPPANPYKWPDTIWTTTTSDGTSTQTYGHEQPLGGIIRSNYCSSDNCTTSKLEVKETPFQIGTTWGQQKQSEVEMTDFERGAIAATFTIYYASMKGLEKLGVPLKKKDKIAMPTAFGAFATPPKGWDGQ